MRFEVDERWTSGERRVRASLKASVGRRSSLRRWKGEHKVDFKQSQMKFIVLQQTDG